MAEWLKAHAWKVCIWCKPYQGFESLSLRRLVMFWGIWEAFGNERKWFEKH